MAESGGGPRQREPLLVSPKEEVAKAWWRLNVKEFHLPNQTNDNQNH